jgi:hypothetical protein
MDLALCSFLDKYSCSGGIYFLHVQGRKIQTSTLKMKAAGSSETLLPIYQATLRHVAEDHNLAVSGRNLILNNITRSFDYHHFRWTCRTNVDRWAKVKIRKRK